MRKRRGHDWTPIIFSEILQSRCCSSRLAPNRGGVKVGQITVDRGSPDSLPARYRKSRSGAQPTLWPPLTARRPNWKALSEPRNSLRMAILRRGGLAADHRRHRPTALALGHLVRSSVSSTPTVLPSERSQVKSRVPDSRSRHLPGLCIRRLSGRTFPPIE